MSIRVCRCCKRTLPISEFVKSKAEKSGYHGYCKKCMRERTAKKYCTDKKYREYLKDYYNKRRENPEKAEALQRYRLKSQLKYRQHNRKKYSDCANSRRWRIKHGIQSKILKRANGKCESCGKEVKKFSIHHLNGNVLDNRIENLIFLCTNCHLKKYHIPFAVYT